MMYGENLDIELVKDISVTDIIRVEIDGDLFMCIMQDDEKAGTVQLWLADLQSEGDQVVLPREWCTEWVGGDYENLHVTGVRCGALASLLMDANEWAYLYRDADKGEFPWQISYQIDFGFLFFHSCGGSILNSNKIVTAAHCCDGIGASDARYS